jgi:hypothetical protein
VTTIRRPASGRSATDLPQDAIRSQRERFPRKALAHLLGLPAAFHADDVAAVR